MSRSNATIWLTTIGTHSGAHGCGDVGGVERVQNSSAAHVQQPRLLFQQQGAVVLGRASEVGAAQQSCEHIWQGYRTQNAVFIGVVNCSQEYTGMVLPVSQVIMQVLNSTVTHWDFNLLVVKIILIELCWFRHKFLIRYPNRWWKKKSLVESR